MPLYRYELTEGECKLCGGSFELRRPLERPDLTNCPVCKKAVRKCIGAFNTPSVLKPIGPAEAENHGFKVYKKVGKGEYEQQ